MNLRRRFEQKSTLTSRRTKTNKFAIHLGFIKLASKQHSVHFSSRSGNQCQSVSQSVSFLRECRPQKAPMMMIIIIICCISEAPLFYYHCSQECKSTPSLKWCLSLSLFRFCFVSVCSCVAKPSKNNDIDHLHRYAIDHLAPLSAPFKGGWASRGEKGERERTTTDKISRFAGQFPLDEAPFAGKQPRA